MATKTQKKTDLVQQPLKSQLALGGVAARGEGTTLDQKALNLTRQNSVTPPTANAGTAAVTRQGEQIQVPKATTQTKTKSTGGGGGMGSGGAAVVNGLVQDTSNPFLKSNVLRDFQTLMDTVPYYTQGDRVTAAQAALDNYGARPEYTQSAAVQGAMAQLQAIEGAGPGAYQESPEVAAMRERAFSYNERPEYNESAAVQAARERLEGLSGRPDAYTSAYADRINALIDQMGDGSEQYVYNPSEDPLYQNYRDQYLRLGRRAMEDTMGNAAGLTGGYGSSYATGAGQQAYQDYMTRLNDVLPSLYDRGYQQFRDQRNDRQALLGNLMNLDDTAYGRYRDTVGDWETDRDYLTNVYNQERDLDYGRYLDQANNYDADRAFYYNQYLNQANTDYGRYRDQVGDWQNERNYALGRYQDERNYDYGQYRDTVGDWETDRSDLENRLANERTYDMNVYDLAADAWDRQQELMNTRLSRMEEDPLALGVGNVSAQISAAQQQAMQEAAAAAREQGTAKPATAPVAQTLTPTAKVSAGSTAAASAKLASQQKAAAAAKAAQQAKGMTNEELLALAKKLGVR